MGSQRAGLDCETFTFFQCLSLDPGHTRLISTASLAAVVPPGGGFHPYGHLVASGDIFGCHGWGTGLLPAPTG